VNQVILKLLPHGANNYHDFPTELDFATSVPTLLTSVVLIPFFYFISWNIVLVVKQNIC